MSLMSDLRIKKLSMEASMIEPFEPRLIGSIDGEKVLSYGLSSYGYDLRVSDHFKLFTNVEGGIVDPKGFKDIRGKCIDVKDRVCLMPPNSFALANSVEYIRMPRNVTAICLGKSTYARCGIFVNVTPLEPSWEGNVTLEISNNTPLSVKVYAFEGLTRLVFFECEQCDVSYSDRDGKYMKQSGITLPL